jgi:hypothetical protein
MGRSVVRGDGRRIQSPHSTAGNRRLPRILVSKPRMREGGQEGRICDVCASASEVQF